MPRTKKRKLEPKSEPEPLPEPAIKQEEEGEEEVEDEEVEDEDEALEEQTLFDDDGDDQEEDEPESAPDLPQNHQAVVDPSNPAPSSADPSADDADEASPESLRKLLEPFAKDLLVDLLRDAAAAHPDVLSAVRRAADADPVHRKIFVHGLGWDTNAETLTAAFSKYGEIEDCNAVRDKISGKSKGYGFILFKHRSGARAALQEPQKKIGNRMTACQLASTGPVPTAPPPAPPVSEYTQRKIYVSNVSADIDPQRLLQFFLKFGEIEEGPLGLDKQTGKPKGFTLFVYKSVESARKALEEPHKNFDGHMLHCQKAIDGPKPNKPFHPHHPAGGARGSHFSRNESNPSFMGGMGNHGAGGAVGPGHLMAPSQSALPYNQGVPPAAAAAAAAAALNPALGQALTALLGTQGGGLGGLTNLLGTLGTAGMAAQGNPNVPAQMVNSAGHGMQGGYGNQGVGNSVGANVMGGYGNQPGMQPGYPNPPMGQGGAGRSQQGVGHMGGVPPYMGH